MMLYKNTKLKVKAPDWDTDYFYIETGVYKEIIPIPVYYPTRQRA